MHTATLAQPTSNEIKREALADVRRSGRGAVQQGLILAFLYNRAALHDGAGATRHDIAESLELALSSVCGRCTELLDLELVEPRGTVGKPARQLLTLTDQGMAHLLALWTHRHATTREASAS